MLVAICKIPEAESPKMGQVGGNWEKHKLRYNSIYRDWAKAALGHQAEGTISSWKFFEIPVEKHIWPKGEIYLIFGFTT